MALIWAEGFSGDRALAPAWQELGLATQRLKQATELLQQDNQKHAGEFAQATIARNRAEQKYMLLVRDATAALKQRGEEGRSHTHVLIVGVGKYDADQSITAVTTSVHGARTFATWALTQFSKADRPLGSVELLCSPTPEQGEWKPSDLAAQKLGLAPGATLPDELATFDNIQRAFTEWLDRSGTWADNAAIWYFSGHGIYKSEAILLPQDAQLPANNRSPENLIAPAKTLFYLQNHQPSVQCFFIDACSEFNVDAIYNVREDLGRSLYAPTGGAAIPARDATIFFGSYAGGKAYGPENDAPFFTQELILCLNQRAGDPAFGGDQVTMASLSTALKAAALHRAEVENNFDIKFHDNRVASFLASLCDLPGPPEVLVQVKCMPTVAMSTALLHVTEAGGPAAKRICRPTPRATFWCTPVARGKWTASVDFVPPAYVSDPTSFEPTPPFTDVTFKVRPP
ncbi:caspase family protein [Bradyrhizobium liaoningense]